MNTPLFNPGDLVKAYHWPSSQDLVDFIGPYTVIQQHQSLAVWSYTLLNPKDGGLTGPIIEGLLRPWDTHGGSKTKATKK